MSRARVVSVVAVALLTACGGGGGDESADDATTVAPTTAAEVTTTLGEVVNDDPVVIDLSHFEIIVDTTVYKAGTINFHAINSDDVPHEFGIARGNSYEELPQLANGSIDEDALGDDFLGKTAVVDKVLSPTRDVTFDLAPGNYVFFCNLVVGPTSHAARGQVLSVTVVE